ncbi:hypothetical protein CERSUDRAFT_89967 [Gelatoporia subvermispora B]|uniref:Uncharacterized protein n=1 Tax=Ceriporiopsis subvermispora (strain B) TaxID=914234 RepID=M2RSJ4_CERS8|nr:hypothetical protein CERSUDRAFT_89967 [Gelatoporia subvermispora B]
MADEISQLAEVVLSINDTSFFTLQPSNQSAGVPIPDQLAAKIDSFNWERLTITDTNKYGVVYNVQMKDKDTAYYVTVKKVKDAGPEACKKALAAGLKKLAEGWETIHFVQVDPTEQIFA